MSYDPGSLARRVLRRCRDLGFAAAGVCDASPTTRPGELRAWLAAGKHGDMEFLANTVETMLDPARELPGVKSVIMVADLYQARPRGEGAAGSGEAAGGGPTGRIARYAQGQDYHPFIKKRLHRLNDELRAEFPGEEFRTFVDTAPVLEREYAGRAGLGWIGKNTLVIHPRLGSYTLLGGTLTTMRLEAPPEQASAVDRCGTCTRCIDACPTGAIAPYTVDATRCLSYLTIERVGTIDAAMHAGMGGWLYGCDVCQEVCPHNSPRPTGGADATPARYAPRREGFDLLEVLGWDESARRHAFTSSAMKRVTLAMMKRNAVIVLANRLIESPLSPWATAARARLAELAGDASEDELVRETARVSLARAGRAGARPGA